MDPKANQLQEMKTAALQQFQTEISANSRLEFQEPRSKILYTCIFNCERHCECFLVQIISSIPYQLLKIKINIFK